FHHERKHHGSVLTLKFRMGKCLMLQVMKPLCDPLSVSPVVVIQRSSIGIQLWPFSFPDDNISSVHQLMDSTLIKVENHFKIIPFYPLKTSLPFGFQS